MAVKFKRAIEREITIKSSVRGIPDAVWILRLSPSGFSARKKGQADPEIRATWRQALGWLLVHRSKP